MLKWHFHQGNFEQIAHHQKYWHSILTRGTYCKCLLPSKLVRLWDVNLLLGLYILLVGWIISYRFLCHQPYSYIWNMQTFYFWERWETDEFKFMDISTTVTGILLLYWRSTETTLYFSIKYIFMTLFRQLLRDLCTFIFFFLSGHSKVPLNFRNVCKVQGRWKKSWAVR